MAEELQGPPGRAAPTHCPGQQIEIIPGGRKYYKHVAHKEDQRAPQILRHHQNHHMGPGNDSRHAHPDYGGILPEGSGQKEDEDDLHELRGLEGQAPYGKGDFRAVGDLAVEQDHAQHHDARDPV